MRANVDDLERLLLRQVVMRDVSHRDPSVEVLGQQLALPIILAPVGLGGMFARRAEVQAARAAEAAGVPFIESTVSICWHRGGRRGDVDPAVVPALRDARPRLRRGSHGAGPGGRPPVLVLTVDLAVVGARHRDIRNAMGGNGRPGRSRRGLDLVTTRGGCATSRSGASRSPSGTSRTRCRARAAPTRSAAGSTPSSIRASPGTTSPGCASTGTAGSSSKACSTPRTPGARSRSASTA